MSTLVENQPNTEAVSADKIAKLEQRADTARHCPACGRIWFSSPPVTGKDTSEPRAARCYVFRSNGFHYAECIDLNILSRGDSEDDAVIRLQHALLSYYVTVVAEDESQRGALDRRPASARSELRYRYYALKSIWNAVRCHADAAEVTYDKYESIGSVAHC